MEVKNATIRLEKKYLDLLDKFGSVNNGVKAVCDKLATIQKLAANELRGKFTENEWQFLAASLNGTIMDETFRYDPSVLCYHNEDAEKYEGHASNFNVDIKAVNKKITALTSAQLDALYTRVEDFWNNAEKIELEALAKF